MKNITKGIAESIMERRTSMDRLIFHIDVNSAFLSWEATERVLRGQEDIRLIPSAIGGDREKRTGVILAKSIPAKKYGVTTGEPIAMALRKCPDLYLAKPNFRIYDKYSKAFMDICREYAPVVEKFSIDECFLDMTGTSKLYPDPIAIANTINDRIREELGFTVNVGISSNKMLAKMASDFEKPDKVHTLFPEEIESKFWPLAVRDLISVGKSTAEKLEKHYIRTIGDLAKADIVSLQRLVGNKLGQHIHNYANGMDESPVLHEREEVKGYSNSTTLEKDVTTREKAQEILLALADSVGYRMRADKVKAYCVAVTIRGNDFKDHSHQRTLFNPTDITNEIYQVSIELFDELWDGYTPLRLLGLALTNITHDDVSQMSLFAEQNEQKEKQKKVDKAMDELRSRFGSGVVTRGGAIQSSKRVGSKHKAQLDNDIEK